MVKNVHVYTTILVFIYGISFSILQSSFVSSTSFLSSLSDKALLVLYIEKSEEVNILLAHVYSVGGGVRVVNEV